MSDEIHKATFTGEAHRGWKASAPPLVRKLFADFAGNGAQGVMEVRAESHVTEILRSSTIQFTGRTMDPSDPASAVSQVMATVAEFLQMAADPDVDVATMAFVNLDPVINMVNPGLEAFDQVAGDMFTPLRLFFESVAGSLRSDGGFSCCEWVMLTLERQG